MQSTPRGRGRGRGRGQGRANAQSQTPDQAHSRSTYPQPSRSQPRHPPRTHMSSHPSVPPISALHPGTPVSIVLKQDQQSGHTVSGIIADLLTRGDHPRGVKVRLQDGRVGRVQRVVSLGEGERGEEIVGGSSAGLDRDGSRGGGVVGGRMERDVRDQDEYLYDEGRKEMGNEGLFAALEEADRRWRDERRGVGKIAEEGVVRCPVCGEFEGDERAVAWHVEGHFGKGG
ncbi:hypothetical protein BDU57DRAFT_134696 [Ampelomyces quisqualis]|uniref:Uncharacterized protein n=1 Tax=Ampelomyces quisqualis TaxID=50730 RepID=A0A6A5QTY3_AMPQU|nr:hypothetical protein BDU57DRAFT_134696 [Ampelomyces quisqualis]